jgi:hypothetical protein
LGFLFPLLREAAITKSPISKDESYSEKETAERRDATIKRMIAMKPKPHSEMKVARKAKKAKRKKSTGASQK